MYLALLIVFMRIIYVENHGICYIHLLYALGIRSDFLYQAR